MPRSTGVISSALTRSWTTVPKKQKTVSIRAINTSSTWQLESAEDVRRCVAELQDRLMKALEEDTIVNIEF